MRSAALASIALLSIVSFTSARAETIRYAVVMGNNAGGGSLAPLRYAESDASKFARVLIEVGEVTEDHLKLLQGRTVGDLESALSQLRGDIEVTKRVPENRVVVMFYFSGHSDGEGLELGSEMLLYSRLKTMLSGVGDVRVVIIDACKSGAGFREKGGKATEPFVIKLTDSLQATGDAYIASSAESEAALESNEVMGSIFTHHLVSGLRGVADTSGDRLVTLAEAYRYAYDQTVARTTLLTAGAQHPSYDYKISGQGDLVLASLQRATAQLIMPAGFERAVISDLLRDQVLAEVPTPATKALALPAGQYGVRIFKGGQSYGGRVSVSDGAKREISWNELSVITSSARVASRGGPVVEQQVVVEKPDLWAQDRYVSLAVGVTPSIGGIGASISGRASFELQLGPSLSFAIQGAHAEKGSVAESSAEVRVGWRYAWRWGPLWVGVGAELGPAMVWQSTASQALASLAGVAAPRVGIRLFVGGPVVLSLEGEAGIAVFGLNGGVGAAFRPSGTAGVGFRF